MSKGKILGKRAVSPEQFFNFGDLLKYLRRREGLTQRELAIQVQYSDTQISRLEQNQRVPDAATITALFVPALHLERESEWTVRLLELAKQARLGELSETDAAEKPVPKNNLPAFLTTFIGREQERANIIQLIRTHRLVTLSGSGGVGKTRLALQVGAELHDHFADGVWWVEFAPLNDAALLPQIVARALGIQEQADREPLETLCSALRDKELMLVLDNCEHLTAACAQLVAAVLRACPGVMVMTTSREPLGITGEMIWQVLPLAVPEPTAGLEIQKLMRYDAIQLFVARAEAVNQHFRLTTQNASAVIELCRGLDGIPLALELAAARARTLSVQQIVERLDDRLNLLTLGDRTALTRHQTLRAAMDWSYELLSPAERVLFSRLAIFVGDFSLEAVEDVCGFEPLETRQTLDLFTRLVDKSLVVLRSVEQPRYAMFQTLREYGLEHLKTEGMFERVQDRHRDYYFRLAAKANTHSHSPDVRSWGDQMEQEYPNFRAALAWSVESGSYDAAQEAVLNLWVLWVPRGHAKEGMDWVSRILALYQNQRRKFAALGLAVTLARIRMDPERVREYLDEMRAVAAADGSAGEMSLVQQEAALSAREQGDYPEAIRLFEDALRLGRQADANNENVPMYFRVMGRLTHRVEAMYWLADILMRAGELERSRALWEEGLGVARDRGDIYHLGWGLGGLADQSLLEGHFDRAIALSRESLGVKLEFKDKGGIAFSWETLANVAANRGQGIRAAMLWGASERYREVIHSTVPAIHQSDYDARYAKARSQLGGDEFADAWMRGREMSFEQAIEYALNTN